MEKSNVSLREEGNGLLETHVRWDEVEEKMRDELKTEARFGPKKSITHIGEGNGFLSRIGLITCDWINSKEGENLPEKFALKMTSGLASKVFEDSSLGEAMPSHEMSPEELEHFEGYIRELHNAEVIVYEFLRKFENEVAVAKCHFAIPFTEKNKLSGSIALEYIKTPKVFHIYNYIPLDQVKEVSRALGKIQALSVINGIEDIEKLKDADLFSGMWDSFTEDILKMLFSSLTQMDKSPEMKTIVEDIIEVVPDYRGSNLVTTIHTQYGVSPVLVNGDLWSANLLFDSETGHLRALIDWQISHQGVGVEDLLRITFAGLSTKDRHDNMDDLLEEMYCSMEEHLNGHKVPYTRKEMYELYEILLPHCGFFLAPVIIPLFQTTMKQAGVNEEEKQKRMGIVLDKVRGICEDIVMYHKKNQSRNRHFEWKEPNWNTRTNPFKRE